MGAALLRILLVLLGLAVLVVLLLLFVPFDVRLRADSELAADGWESRLTGRADVSFRLRWGLLFLTGRGVWTEDGMQWSALRLMGLPLRGSRKGAGRKAGGPEAGKPEGGQHGRESGRKRRRSPRADPALVLTIAREAVRLPGRLWCSLGVRLTAEATYGFPDPSLTGFCEAVRWSTGLGRSLHLTPDFQRPCLIGRGELTGRLYGFRLLAIAWQVVRQPAIWNHLVSKIRFRPLRRILLGGGV